MSAATSPVLAIIDYGSGNLRSATKAFERAAREAGIDVDIRLTADPEVVRKAARIVLPGVGAYADCRQGLDAVPGMTEALREAVEASARPFLGICVGMQLMASRGLEKTITDGFGWIEGDVVPIVPSDASLKIPQIGWNTIDVAGDVPGDRASDAPGNDARDTVRHPLLAGIPTGEQGLHAYFVHSYQLAAKNTEDILATTDYGGKVTAIVANGNKAGTQFHPEKSQRLGLQLLTNFLTWAP